MLVKNLIESWLSSFGKYFLFLSELFVRREKFKIYYGEFIEECVKAGTQSAFIVIICSSFMGIVSTIQTALNLESPFVADWFLSVVVRDMTIVGLAPNVISFILAGKIGSQISNELGTMSITEQIDAMEVLGINALSYLALPRILAAMIMFPMLVILACFFSILGGYCISTFLSIVAGADFVYGLRFNFNDLNVTYALTKACVFGFLVSSIASFKGIYLKGGTIELSNATTSGVATSCVSIMVADLVITNLFFN
jgi:phospholipid/cholesterol/gamma-HCH transport system permease protein